jgi:hypothetical protein
MLAFEAGVVGDITTPRLHTGPFVVPATKEQVAGLIDDINWDGVPVIVIGIGVPLPPNPN